MKSNSACFTFSIHYWENLLSLFVKFCQYFLYENYALMAGCLDTVKMPNMEWLETTLRDRRNLVASISSGVLVSELKKEIA